jgi:hypothetical protein
MIMAIMTHFGETMRLRINVSKSSVAAIRCSQVNLDEVMQNFNGQRAMFPVSYLGLPITLGCLKISHLQFILDRASAKLSGWHDRMFNLGGRRELVRSVLISMPTYLMTALRPPKRFYKDLDKIRCCFLWSGTSNSKVGSARSTGAGSIGQCIKVG